MLKIIQTEDGSESIFDDELNETYHSTKGARSESEYVFIEYGLNERIKIPFGSELHVFEVGMGTGLNLWLTQKWSLEKQIKVNYVTLEPYPISEEILSQMGFGEDPTFKLIHTSNWDEDHKLHDHFRYKKLKTTLENVPLECQFDVIFFDAFGPAKQPEVWSLSNIEKCYKLLNKNGIWSTYSAQGQLKRNLKSAGFELEVLPGALGKKEMVRGRKG